MLDLLLNDGNTTMVGVLVFLANATLTFSVRPWCACRVR